MEIEGKVIEKFDIQEITEKFKKRDFVVEYLENPQSQYTELLKFELMQDNCEKLDAIDVGDMVEIRFNLRGRKWVNPEGESKYFNSLVAWRIEKKGEENVGMSDLPGNPPKPPTDNDDSQDASDSEDDLPF